ncbi:uncharacterized protein LOC120334963 [Styela clava]
MKPGIYAIYFMFASMSELSFAAPAKHTEIFTKCKATYKTLVEHIVASEGEEAKSTIWKFLFHDIDLDANGQIAASEIALFLEKEHYIHDSDIMETMIESSNWIEVADSNQDEELTIEEFMTAVQKTIVESNDLKGGKFSEVPNNICHLFINKIPHLAEVMTELESCTKHLEESMLTDNSERAEFNSWAAIFKTMDENQDGKIDFGELRTTIGHTLTNDEDIALANALGHAIYGDIMHDVEDLTEKHFYMFVHELLYGIKESNRKNVWEDIVSEHELRGRSMMCKAIRDVRMQLSNQRDVMNDCIKSYEATRNSILGADGVFAPEIVFTMADGDRDGEISQEEFDIFIGSHSTLYSLIERKHASKDMKIGQFRSVMPDAIVTARKENDARSMLESSSMTALELHDAEKLCSAIISSVEKYPSHEDHTVTTAENHESNYPQNLSYKGMGEYTFREHTLPHEEESTTPANTDVMHLVDHNGNPMEIVIKHPEGFPAASSFKGSGEYIWKEHTLPAEEVKATPGPAPGELVEAPLGSESIHPIGEKVHPNGEVVYHMVDAEGNQIELTFTRKEIDDIEHRMAEAKGAPVEPHHTESPSKQPPSNSEESELMKEIEKILAEKDSPAEEKLPESNGETEEEKELQELLKEMESSREST